jgi:hypothetical protein
MGSADVASGSLSQAFVNLRREGNRENHLTIERTAKLQLNIPCSCGGGGGGGECLAITPQKTDMENK